MACEQTKDNVPQEFICPLTLGIMVEPVMNREGQSYERSAIVEWLSQSNATCPLTRKPINISNFVSNRFLQKKIRTWREDQGGDMTESETESSSDGVDAWIKMGVGVEEFRAPRLLKKATAQQVAHTSWRRVSLPF